VPQCATPFPFKVHLPPTSSIYLSHYAQSAILLPCSIWTLLPAVKELGQPILSLSGQKLDCFEQISLIHFIQSNDSIEESKIFPKFNCRRFSSKPSVEAYRAFGANPDDRTLPYFSTTSLAVIWRPTQPG
jgi:hypothetical protein